MSLKNKILLILLVAAVAAAVFAGGFLLVLLNMIGPVEVEVSDYPVVLSLAVTVYLVCGLLPLVLLNRLLNKHVIMPVIERELLENEKTMLARQLHHSQKMEAVGQLAGSIAHDFNNLLTIIDGYSSLIIANPRSGDTERHAHEVVEAARKASIITRKLLSFSQKDENEPILLDLNTTLQDTQKMLSRLIGDKVTLVTKEYREPIYALADPVQIGQVLMNLAVNARDAMPNGGRISIKIDCRDVQDGELNKPPKIAAGRFVEIAVHDTGVGIDAEILPRIFEAFFTTKQEGKGAGLGLSIVKGIMKENKGFITVQSKVGSGTTFFLYLPVVELADRQSDDAEQPAESSKKEETSVDRQNVGEADQDEPGATILLAEDDPMIRSLVAQTLESFGLNVLVAEDGWEGIKIARNYKGTIHLLFTDVVMPGLGGAELAVAMNELYPGIKVLFMSGYSRSQLVEEGISADALLLEKPFTPERVLTMVRRALGE
ncbi:MAG: response regulator [Pontiellaceae bacterium]|nr:response regulator [Pontiellaceae bacterium]MBN2785461.1 response regulator [Pontiellaceae bacterium]